MWPGTGLNRRHRDFQSIENGKSDRDAPTTAENSTEEARCVFGRCRQESAAVHGQKADSRPLRALVPEATTSEWARQDFVATVDIFACGEAPLDRKTYRQGRC
jgi:hypothetical protein